VTVRPAKDGKYALIAGECRWKASAIAGKQTIPALVRLVSDQQALELTIVENLQRQDLNCLDQARAFDRLNREFQLTQEEIAVRTGQTRSTVSNYMRLLRLPKQVQDLLASGQVSFGQAKVILGVEDPGTQIRLAQKAATQGTTVRQLEELVFHLSVPASGGREAGEKRYVDPNVRQAQGDLERVLGVRVKIRDSKGKGSILLQYRNLEDFDRVVGMLSGK
jgi:ParB family chromosome partitioning protein